MSHTYELHVKGHLDDGWSGWLGGLAVHRQEDGTTLLVGQVVDPSALYGLINQLRDLGLELLSLRRTGPCDDGRGIQGNLDPKGDER